jgi:hypothetical protein
MVTDFKFIKHEVDSLPKGLGLFLENTDENRFFLDIRDSIYEKGIKSFISKAKFKLTPAPYNVNRLSFPVEVSKEKTEYFKVFSMCAIDLLGIRFVSGDGWGKYCIKRGVDPLFYFEKSKIKDEDGVAVSEIHFYSDDVLSIIQVNGDGKLQLELIGFELRIPGATSVLLPIDKKY